jgi:Domain of unknown function (DUF3854)
MRPASGRFVRFAVSAPRSKLGAPCRVPRAPRPSRSRTRPPENKYISSADRASLWFQPGAGVLLADAAVPAVLSEAEKAGLTFVAAAERSERRLLSMALGGCWGWRGRIGKTVSASGRRVDEVGPLPDLARVVWRGREALIVFDTNTTDNASVQAAVRGLARELSNRGARVRVVNVPAEAGVNGPDDFLAIHGDAALWALLDNAGHAGIGRSQFRMRSYLPSPRFSRTPRAKTGVRPTQV